MVLLDLLPTGYHVTICSNNEQYDIQDNGTLKLMNSQDSQANNALDSKDTEYHIGLVLKDTKTRLNLMALEEINKNPNISQRELSNRLGVALGITNALLKNLVHKGLVKIRGKNNRSLSYHLTHDGALEKSRLAVRWTLNTIDFYRQARRNVADRLNGLAGQGIETAFLYGLSELTEIAVIVAPEVGLEVIGIIDDYRDGVSRKTLDYPVIKIDQLKDVHADAIVICVEMSDVQREELIWYSQDEGSIYSII